MKMNGKTSVNGIGMMRRELVIKRNASERNGRILWNGILSG